MASSKGGNLLPYHSIVTLISFFASSNTSKKNKFNFNIPFTLCTNSQICVCVCLFYHDHDSLIFNFACLLQIPALEKKLYRVSHDMTTVVKLFGTGTDTTTGLDII